MSSSAQVASIGGNLGILPVDYLPSTPVLARIRHANEPEVTANLTDGSRQHWTFDEFVAAARLHGDESIGSVGSATASLDAISTFDIGLPVDILRNGVEFVDSPGIGEADARSAITLAEGKNAHAAVFVLRNDNFIGQDELETLDRVLAHTGKVFVVTNRFAQLDEARYSKALSGRLQPLREGVDGDKIASQIVSVDCLSALRSRHSGDQSGLISSGLPTFERQLGNFLQTEIYPTKQRSYIDGLLILIEDTQAELRKIIATARADADTANEVFARCERDLADIDSRRNRISLLLDSFRTSVVSTAQTSFRHRCKALSESLESKFAEHRISKLDNTFGKVSSLMTQSAATEALEILKQIIERDLEAWAAAPTEAPGLSRDLALVFEKGRQALASEFAGIDRSINDIALRISTLDAEGGMPASSVSFTDRFASMAVGTLLFGPLGLLSGALGGWRGTAGATAGLIGANVLLIAGTSILGLAFSPALIGALLVASTLGGGVAGGLYQIERRIRDKALEQMLPIVDGLASNDAVLGAITGKLDSLIQGEIDAVMGAIDKVVGQQSASLQRLRTVNGATAQDRESIVARAEEAAAALRPAKARLAKLTATLRSAAASGTSETAA